MSLIQLKKLKTWEMGLFKMPHLETRPISKQQLRLQLPLGIDSLHNSKLTQVITKSQIFQDGPRQNSVGISNR